MQAAQEGYGKGPGEGVHFSLGEEEEVRKGEEGRGARRDEEEDLSLPSIPVPEDPTRVFLVGRLHPSRFKTIGIVFKEKVPPSRKSVFNLSSGGDCGDWTCCVRKTVPCSRTTGSESIRLHAAAGPFGVPLAPSAHTSSSRPPSALAPLSAG